MFLLTQTAERNMLNELTARVAVQLGLEAQDRLTKTLTESVINQINTIIRATAETGDTYGQVDVVHNIGKWNRSRSKDAVYIDAPSMCVLDNVVENINRHYDELEFQTEFELVNDHPVTSIYWE
jgi:hypothetical protein